MTDTTPIPSLVTATLIELAPMDFSGPFVQVADDLNQAALCVNVDEALVLADSLRELAAEPYSEADQVPPIAVTSDVTAWLIDGDRPPIELLAYPDMPSVRAALNMGVDEARQLADRLYELADGRKFETDFPLGR